MFFKCEKPAEVAKEMFWLAWTACGGTLGMGFMQDRGPSVTKDDIWQQVSGQVAGDYVLPQGEAAHPYGDYVFGRMMKFGVRIEKDGLELSDHLPTRDYNSWCGKYPTAETLAEAAVASL